MKVKFIDNNIPINLIEIEEKDMSMNVVDGFPTAIKSSDNSKYVGKGEILKLLSSYINTNTNIDIDDNTKNKNEIQIQNNIIYDENSLKQQQINDKIFNQQMTNQNSIMNNMQNPIIIRPMDNQTMDMLMSEQNKGEIIFVYSINCSYSRMILPKWQNFVKNNYNKYNILEIESANLNKYPNIFF